MTNDQEILFSSFETRVHQLLSFCDELKLEIDALKMKQKEMNDLYDTLLEENKNLKYKYDNLKMTRIITVRQDDFKAAKNRLSKLVREVDKCIALLNK